MVLIMFFNLVLFFEFSYIYFLLLLGVMVSLIWCLVFLSGWVLWFLERCSVFSLGVWGLCFFLWGMIRCMLLV